jgi:hypothetical protein
VPSEHQTTESVASAPSTALLAPYPRLRVDKGRFIWVVAPGICDGAFDLRTRGYRGYSSDINAWPNRANRYRLFTGGFAIYATSDEHWFSVKLWPVESYIFLKERRLAIEVALRELEITHYKNAAIRTQREAALRQSKRIQDKKKYRAIYKLRNVKGRHSTRTMYLHRLFEAAGQHDELTEQGFHVLDFQIYPVDSLEAIA